MAWAPSGVLAGAKSGFPCWKYRGVLCWEFGGFWLNWLSGGNACGV